MQEKRSADRANATLSCTSALGGIASILKSTYVLIEQYSPAQAVPYVIVGAIGLVAAEILCPDPIAETVSVPTEPATNQLDQEQYLYIQHDSRPAGQHSLAYRQRG